MSALKIRQPPKLTAIPIPIHTIHKQRHYSQPNTVKPKVNWSRYSFLPAIGTTELDEFVQNENDLHNNGPSKFDDISDSEFLYDQMTAESDEMIKREAEFVIIREKAFLQFLELKSDYLDWVIKMAHKDVWVSVKNDMVHDNASTPQPSMTDNPEKHVSSSPTTPKDITIDTDNPDLLVPKQPSQGKNQSDSSLSTDMVIHKPPANPKDQPRSSASPQKFVPTPPAYPKNLSATVLRNKNVMPKSVAYRKDLSDISLGNDSTEPETPTFANYLPEASLGNVNILPKPPAYHKDLLANMPGNESIMPIEEDQSRPTSRLSGQYIVSKLPNSNKGSPSDLSSPVLLVPKSPAFLVKLPQIRGSRETKIALPSPPAYSRPSKTRKVRRPDAITELGSTSSSQIPELPTPRIVLALI